MNIWQGAHSQLRAIEPSDAEWFFEWNHDSDTARMVDFVWPPGSLEAAKKWAQEMATRKPDGDRLDLVIETLAGTLVGVINAHHCDRRTGAFKYGVAIRQEFRRKGYASEAVLLLLRYFFDELRYQKVTVDVYSNNPASAHLHERLGFQLEGRVRRVVFTQGRHYDLLLYGMTVEEFRARYPAATFESWLDTVVQKR